ncbi:hypothetical protein C8F04DRAFT_1110316 [Mycena alexandri]|uniref:DUF7029 domain-containing protein n=1 Tax=Mycena alexandri TaxID=1745969 RepID=A0AAD6SPW9_9AGAR|nr:hypothetical protein C8F04DRAFT_1110316 [Mycena alexandri]
MRVVTTVLNSFWMAPRRHQASASSQTAAKLPDTTGACPALRPVLNYQLKSPFSDIVLASLTGIIPQLAPDSSPGIQMSYSYYRVLALAFFIKALFAFAHADTHVPSAYTTLTLHPGIHPDDVLSDLENLKAKKANSLYYTSGESSPAYGASIIQVKHLLPAVLLERSTFVTSVTCDIFAETISVTFAHKESFRTALEDWRSHDGGFLLVSYVPSCGVGTESLERSFHLVSRVSSAEPGWRIVCHAKMVPIHETVHPDQEITIHAATFALDGPPLVQPVATVDERVPRNRARKSTFRNDAVNFLLNFNPTFTLTRFVAEQIPFNTKKSSHISKMFRVWRCGGLAVSGSGYATDGQTARPATFCNSPFFSLLQIRRKPSMFPP